MIDRISELRSAAGVQPAQSPSLAPSSSPRFSSALRQPLRSPSLGSGGSLLASPSLRQSGGSNIEPTDDSSLQRFLAQLETIRSGPLKELEELLEDSKRYHAQALKAVAPHTEREAVALVESCAERYSGAAARTGKVLQELASEVDKPPTGHGRMSASEMHLRRQSFSGVTVLYQNALNDFFKIQQTFSIDMKAKVHRQLRVAFPEADEAAIATVVAGRNSATSTIQNSMLMQPGQGQLSTSMTLEMSRERCNELESFVKVARDLRQAFEHVDLLVASQGETIDDIGRHVQATRDQTSAARDYLELTDAAQRRMCKWRWCAVGTLCFATVAVASVAFIAHHL